MTLIYTNGAGGGNYTDPATWSGGVVPYQANGDTSLILNGDSIVDSIPMNEICEENLGYIQINYGIVYLNNGTIYDNGGYVYINSDTINRGVGTVYENYATIDWLESGGQISYGNYQGSTVTTNDGYIPYNFGFINNHNGQVDWNDQSGSIYYVNGYVNNNYNGAYVEEITSGGTVNWNGSGCNVNVVYGTIDDNYGTANNIAYGGYVGRNYYDIIYNGGTVNINYSTVVQTQSGGIINTNETTGFCLNAPYGYCTDNYGYCNNVAGTVSTNFSGGIVDNGDNAGIWGGYYGVVNQNQVGGIIRVNGGNNSGGTPSTVIDNYGTILENYGIVTNNKSYSNYGGIIYRNGYNGVSPSAWVEVNEVGAIVHRNEYGATVNYNYGEVHQKDGYVTYPQSGGLILFSSINATSITDPSSGAIYGIAPDAFSDPIYYNVKQGINYLFNEETVSGTLVPITQVSGLLISNI